MKIETLASTPSMKPLSAVFQAPDERSSAPSFGAVMREAVDSTNRLQEQADREIQALAVGKNGDLHKTMIAMEEAGVSFSLLMQVRNRIVAAYQEIMRMQI